MSVIRIEENSGEWQVWAEPDEHARYIGLCVGSGDSKLEAVSDALRDLTELKESLLKQLE